MVLIFANNINDNFVSITPVLHPVLFCNQSTCFVSSQTHNLTHTHGVRSECNLACMYFHECELFMFTFNYNNVFHIQSSITCGGLRWSSVGSCRTINSQALLLSFTLHRYIFPFLVLSALKQKFQRKQIWPVDANITQTLFMVSYLNTNPFIPYKLVLLLWPSFELNKHWQRNFFLANSPLYIYRLLQFKIYQNVLKYWLQL